MDPVKKAHRLGATHIKYNIKGLTFYRLVDGQWVEVANLRTFRKPKWVKMTVSPRWLEDHCELVPLKKPNKLAVFSCVRFINLFK